MVPGVSQGSGAISAAEATKLAQAGVSPTSSAFTGMGQLGPLEAALPGLTGNQVGQQVISPDQLAEAQLLGTGADVRALQVAQESRKAPFTGGGGLVADTTGVVGAGSAAPIKKQGA